VSVFSIVSKIRFEIPGVSGDNLVTKVIVKKWISELVWVSRGVANLHIQRTAYTKWGKGVELHSSFLRHESFFKKEKKTFKYAILVNKDEF